MLEENPMVDNRNRIILTKNQVRIGYLSSFLTNPVGFKS